MKVIILEELSQYRRRLITPRPGNQFELNESLNRLGEALARCPKIYSRIHRSADEERIIVAGVIWERPYLPPREFFTWLRDCQLTKNKGHKDGWQGIKPTQKFLELLREGAWQPQCPVLCEGDAST